MSAGPLARRTIHRRKIFVHLIQILLPLYDRQQRRVSRCVFDQTAADLAAESGGVTAYTRSPAKGLWRKSQGKFMRDDIVVYEVMCRGLDKAAWRSRRKTLERSFGQDEIVIRALASAKL
jgi:hypothetical protein